MSIILATATGGAIRLFSKGVVREWDLKDICGGMMQFMGLQLFGLILIIAFPQIAL